MISQFYLECRVCCRHKTINATTSMDARKIAVAAGWELNAVTGDTCSKCAPAKVPT